MTRVSVWKLGKWTKSRHGSYQTMQVQMKMIDNGNKTVKLNLQSDQPQKQDWLRVLVEGNVIQVTTMMFQGELIVNKYGQFRGPEKNVNGLEAVDEHGALPTQLEMFHANN